MTRKHTRYSKKMLEELAPNCSSLAQILEHVGLKPTGGNYRHLKGKIDLWGIDVSHFKGQAYAKDLELKPFTKLQRPSSIKKRLIRELGHECQSCHLSEWMGKPIPLELEHIDGVHANNSRENLTLLCCNCHALTDTYKRKKV